jgi:PEGA domain
MRKAVAIMGLFLVGPIFADPAINGATSKDFTLVHPDLLACSDAAMRNVSFSLSIPGALMGTTPTSGQFNPKASGTPPCTQRLTITSTPCGATIYIDGMQSGRTPITFPMPPGRYSVLIVAPGHQRFSQRILISDSPFELKADLIPLP